MQHAKNALSTSPKSARARESYRRALKYAGFGPEAEAPDDIEEFRSGMARRMNILIGTRMQYWRGCPERGCRRQRACLAPNIQCSNAPPLPPSSAEETQRAMARVQRALRDALAARGEEE
jgi:hypothetical protein